MTRTTVIYSKQPKVSAENAQTANEQSLSGMHDLTEGGKI